MEITLAYGGARLTAAIPAGVIVDTYSASAVEHPTTYAMFADEFARSGAEHFLSASSLLFIVNDGFRHTPTAQVLDWLAERMPGVVERAHFLIATGSHKPPTDAHYQSIFGRHLAAIRERLHYHVATDAASMAKVGVDSFGQDVFVNKLLYDFDRMVIIGSVEPHFFAGYTGGRKAIFPGICDLATTERNHNLANSLEAQPLRLAGNPVAEHLQSLMSFVSDRQILSIQIVADASHRIGFVSIGNVESSFTRAVAYAHALYARVASQPYDAILCEVLPPLDKNMYQAQKAIENSLAALVPGGTIVSVSACKEGIGSDFFYQEASRWDPVANRPGDGIYRFGSHKLTRMVAHQRRSRVCLKSELPDAIVKAVYYYPIDDLGEYLTEHYGASPARIAVVHDAAHTVLTTKQLIYSTNSTEEKVT